MTTRVICAWCQGTIRGGSTADDDSSHGICFACVQSLGLFPTEDIRELSREQLDALPIGVIELDHLGIVQRYNIAEARAAGTTVDAVVGRHFFDDVAPCTSVREFRGRCEQMMQSARAERDELDFVFQFRAGDRFAHLVFAWDPRPRRLTILIDLMGDEADHERRASETWRA